MKPRVPKPLTKFAQKLRREMTPQEQQLWQHLRLDQFKGYRFRRQHPIPPYVADFANLRSRVVIELDGSQHDGERDQARDAFMAAQGWTVLRFSNQQLGADVNYVLERIAHALTTVPPPPSLPLTGEG